MTGRGPNQVMYHFWMIRWEPQHPCLLEENGLSPRVHFLGPCSSVGGQWTRTTKKSTKSTKVRKLQVTLTPGRLYATWGAHWPKKKCRTSLTLTGPNNLPPGHPERLTRKREIRAELLPWRCPWISLTQNVETCIMGTMNKYVHETNILETMKFVCILTMQKIRAWKTWNKRETHFTTAQKPDRSSYDKEEHTQSLHILAITAGHWLCP